MNTLYKPSCHVEAALAVIGGKWKLPILWHLREGALRFSELEKRIPGVTQKMLSQQLKELVREKLITRKVFPVVPPKVEYQVTDHGKSLDTVLTTLSVWGQKHLTVKQKLQ